MCSFPCVGVCVGGIQARTFPRDLCTVNLDEGTISCDLSGQTGALGGLWGGGQVGSE
jgi:hypothetical protein